MAHRKGYYREYYQKRMSAILEALGGKCVYCGSIYNLEIDHIDPRNKSFTIRSYNKWSDILEELKKCQCLCSICHRDKTVRESIGDQRVGGKRVRSKHGTVNKYQSGCRCSLCKSAVSRYRHEAYIRLKNR